MNAFSPSGDGFLESVAGGQALRMFGATSTLLVLAGCAGTGSPAADCESQFLFARDLEQQVFYRGNTHTHTRRSPDSTELVTDVVMWFRRSGYNFVVLTDHDISATPGEFHALETGSFIVIAGEEITSSGVTRGGGVKPVHVNSICSNGATVGGTTLDGVAYALRDAVRRAIRVADAVAQVNHPNYWSALTAADIAWAGGAQLVEIANQHPDVDNPGTESRVSTEQIWDEVLRYGRAIYGVASDDTHELAPDSATPPGRGWIQVAARELSPEAICEALGEGLFYASTGPALSRIAASGTVMQLEISAGPGQVGDDYTTAFIGRGGKVLQTVVGLSPSYELRGDELYVRAKVVGPGEKSAWVQPGFVEERKVCDSAIVPPQ